MSYYKAFSGVYKGWLHQGKENSTPFPTFCTKFSSKSDKTVRYVARKMKSWEISVCVIVCFSNMQVLPSLQSLPAL